LIGLLRTSFAILLPFFSLRPIASAGPHSPVFLRKVFKKLDLGVDLVDTSFTNAADGADLTGWFVKSTHSLTSSFDLDT